MKTVVFLYIPCPTEEKAKELARQLLETRLIACANIWPVGSVYRWEKKVVEEKEWVLLVKTTGEKEAAVRREVEKLHPYTVPCIASFPVTLNENYGKWLQKEVTQALCSGSAKQPVREDNMRTGHTMKRAKRPVVSESPMGERVFKENQHR